MWHVVGRSGKVRCPVIGRDFTFRFGSDSRGVPKKREQAITLCLTFARSEILGGFYLENYGAPNSSSLMEELFEITLEFQKGILGNESADVKSKTFRRPSSRAERLGGISVGY